QNLTPMFPGGVMGLIAASALLYTLLAGGLFGIEMGDEVKDARAVIPKALIISIAMVLVVYLFIEVIAVGVMDWKIFATGTLGEPAKAFLSGPFLAFFVIGGGILASVTTINLALTAAGRYVLTFAHEGFFANVFERINAKFGTPHHGLTLAYAIAVITLLLNPPLQMLAAMLNFGLLFMVTLVLFAAFNLPQKHPEIYKRSRIPFSPRILKVTSLTAIAINMVFMVILAVALKWTFLLFVAAAATGVGLFFIRRRKLASAPAGS
ncbi:MAG: APC family permease, partial [Chloroflexota bacterium]|nr:APC family permease [Chloroflexota bacterium]